MSQTSSVHSAVRAFHRYREALAQESPSRLRAGECPTCLGEHNEDIHGATIRVHRWFRTEVTRGLGRRLPA